jgi:hypothetical protein
MAQETDEVFFNRADAHINLANEQAKSSDPGRAAASMTFAAARFTAWLVSLRYQSAEKMRANREDALKHFVEQYKQMLNDNIEDHIRQLEAKGMK